MKSSNVVWVVALGAVAYYLYTKAASANASAVLTPVDVTAQLLPLTSTVSPGSMTGVTGSW